ncbi:Alpha/Beta hydrolase protein [Coniochaeta sp. 2T2.1]|nr:Alpha/Beta hydrolase protein [Coniochaeta sp. 2T2.1]
MSSCCLKGFEWDGRPNGVEKTLNGQSYYVTGASQDVAILVVHDLYGWTFTNARLLADHYAAEVGATVYVPDFRGSELTIVVVSTAPCSRPPSSTTLPNGTNSTSRRFLRTKHQRIGAVGFCYGGWAVFQLGARSPDGSGGGGSPLVDCISATHPTFLTEDEIRKVGVPVQIVAPERDPMFTEELKAYAVAEIPKLGVPFDYQFFPGLEHGFAVRGNSEDEAEMKGMERAMRVTVAWFREWLLL